MGLVNLQTVIAKDLLRLPQILNEELDKSLDDLGDKLVDKVRSKMRRDTGRGQASVKAKVTGRGLRKRLDVESKLVQVAVDEEGRRPGAPMPPSQAARLVSWARRKGFTNTFVLARSIGKKGIRANRPFARTQKEERSLMTRSVQAGLNRAGNRLNGGA
ncbi:MAG: hypothetical protein MSG64_06375 [Pyrinomonadaceae bacterium MAG19_C2-C3]|nr:hypothetical protein [Pyrinomonadaceae bacterium MAG19_C2-C3]